MNTIKNFVSIQWLKTAAIVIGLLGLLPISSAFSCRLHQHQQVNSNHQTYYTHEEEEEEYPTEIAQPYRTYYHPYRQCVVVRCYVHERFSGPRKVCVPRRELC